MIFLGAVSGRLRVRGKDGVPPETLVLPNFAFDELFSARASGHRARRKGAHVKPKLPTRRMREHPDLEQLKRLAKELLRAYSAGDPAAAAEVNAHYHDADPAKFALHDAQLVIARG